MAERKQIGLEIVTEAIKSGVPEPIPLNKLMIDDFTGDGGKSILEGRREERYKPPEPYHAPDLGTAFEHFLPTKIVEVPSSAGNKRYRLTFESVKDFEPTSIEKKVPELKSLASEEQGLKQLLSFLETDNGDKRLHEFLADANLLQNLDLLRTFFEEYLKRIEKVLPEVNEG